MLLTRREWTDWKAAGSPRKSRQNAAAHLLPRVADALASWPVAVTPCLFCLLFLVVICPFQTRARSFRLDSIHSPMSIIPTDNPGSSSAAAAALTHVPKPILTDRLIPLLASTYLVLAFAQGLEGGKRAANRGKAGGKASPASTAFPLSASSLPSLTTLNLASNHNTQIARLLAS